MRKELNNNSMEELCRAFFNDIAKRSRGEEDLTDLYLPMSPNCKPSFSGIKNGELMIVFGKAGTGKTAFILQLAKNLASAGKKSVFLISPEHPAQYILKRMIITDSGICDHSLDSGMLAEGEWNDLRKSLQLLSKLPVTVFDSSYIPLNRLSSMIGKAVKDRKADVVLIDRIDYLGYSESNAQKVETLKKISLANNVPIICTCHIPYLFDSVNKSAFIRKTAEHADVSSELWIDFDRLDENKKASLYVLKDNKGGRATFSFAFDRERLVFTDRSD